MIDMACPYRDIRGPTRPVYIMEFAGNRSGIV